MGSRTGLRCGGEQQVRNKDCHMRTLMRLTPAHAERSVRQILHSQLKHRPPASSCKPSLVRIFYTSLCAA